MENSVIAKEKFKIKNLVGDKKFYRHVLTIALPIMLQNGITNFVGMLDNIMVGRVGTEQMSGVSIVNQLLFILMLCIFGATSGAGVLGAQFYGKGDYAGVRNVFRIKIILSVIILGIAAVIFTFWGSDLISLYLHDGSQSGNLASTLKYGEDYLKVMLVGQIPMAFECTYSSTLRESGETAVPMKASIVAVFVNLVLNYLLIFGKFGFPVMGVVGAAVATVISRFVQLTIVVIYSHRHLDKNPYFEGVYKSFKVPGELIGKITVLALPLLLNETLWSMAVATQTACFSQRGLAVVAGLNINSTINNVFNIVFIALGDSVAIIVGQLLGAGKVKEGKDTAYKIIAFSVVSCFVLGTLMFLTAPLFPQIYNTTDEVKTLATNFIRVNACMMPLQGFLHSSYFTIRSGGKTFITFLFDAGFMWVVAVPLAFLLIKLTTLPILMVYVISLSADLIKITIGVFILRSGIWARSLV